MRGEAKARNHAPLRVQADAALGGLRNHAVRASDARHWASGHPRTVPRVSWEEIVSGLIVGAVAGVVAIIVWESGRQLLRRRRLQGDFGHLAGDYIVTRKLNPSVRERGIAHIDVEGSRLKVTFRDLEPDESITGEIGMNESMPRSGRGHYHHVDGDEKWGFWDVQVVRDSLLVHTTYAHHEEHYPVVSGFVWKQV